jgi:FkbM family methyltransferase
MQIKRKFWKWYNLAKARWHRRRFYRSTIDVCKTFYLSATAPDEPGATSPLLRGFWVKPAAVADPVWIRCKSSDFFVLKEIFEDGEYGSIQQWNLPLNATVLDLGGNIGLASLYFASALPASRIVVVEPDHSNCISIARTCKKIIASGRMQIIEAFVAGFDGEAGIDRNARSWAFKMTDQPPALATERIRCVSIPTLMSEFKIETIDLLKCDIEGTETQLFANCKTWIGRVNHLIVETHAPYKLADLFQNLRQANWDFEILSQLQEDKVGLVFLRHSAAQPAQRPTEPAPETAAHAH